MIPKRSKCSTPHASSLGRAKDLRKRLNELHPLRHLGEPGDVGWAVVYLGSEESKFVTGSELAVDGGYTAR